jgi:hypothetical protein
VIGKKLRENPALADATGDQLRVLASVVEDDHLVDPGRVLDRCALVGQLGGRRRLGYDVVGLVRRAGAHAGVVLRAPDLSAGDPLDPPLDEAADPRLPIPTPCELCSSLPSVCRAGATISSARLNSAMSW